MQITHLALILLLSISSINGYPTKPLDERSTELAWQAWLLVQNNDTDGVSRKKVVPKSVFIAPDFDRPCPDGLQKDLNDRCIKLHDLDNEGQLDFLYAKLFSSGKSDEVQNQATPGPAHIRIPIPVRAVESIEEIVDGLTIVDSGKVAKDEDVLNPGTKYIFSNRGNANNRHDGGAGGQHGNRHRLHHHGSVHPGGATSHSSQHTAYHHVVHNRQSGNGGLGLHHGDREGPAAADARNRFYYDRNAPVHGGNHIVHNVRFWR